MSRANSKAAIFRMFVTENIGFTSVDQMVQKGMEIGLSKYDAQWYLKKEFGVVIETSRSGSATATDKPVVDKPKGRLQMLRNKVAECKDSMTPKELLDWVVEELKYSVADARFYVKKELGCDASAFKDGETNPMNLTKKELKVQKKKVGSLNNLSELNEFMQGAGFQTKFDGIVVDCDLGTISMVFGDFYLTRKDVIEGQPAVECMSPAHMRRFLQGEDSKLGKLVMI